MALFPVRLNLGWQPVAILENYSGFPCDSTAFLFDFLPTAENFKANFARILYVLSSSRTRRPGPMAIACCCCCCCCCSRPMKKLLRRLVVEYERRYGTCMDSTKGTNRCLATFRDVCSCFSPAVAG